MLFEPLFERFASGTPLSVMTRALLENALQPDPLDELFEREHVGTLATASLTARRAARDRGQKDDIPHGVSKGRSHRSISSSG